jgi:methionyl-tRNA formyltransferase
MMKVTLLCTNSFHPVYHYLKKWCSEYKDIYDIQLLESAKDIKKCGDILFLVSCSEIVNKQTRDLFRYTLVLHASDLPKGRGWSPHIWDIVNGKNELTLSLLNAGDSVDTGDIWKKKKLQLQGTELYDEINHLLFSAEIELITWACENVDICKPKKQDSAESNYCRQRTPLDSEIDPNKTISKQFNLLRVSDPERFPAFFTLNGKKYKIIIERQK